MLYAAWPPLAASVLFALDRGPLSLPGESPNPNPNLTLTLTLTQGPVRALTLTQGPVRAP
eukprot:scaffold83141_cov44-Phaeocystis_antarctica.AAC.1